MRCIYPPSGEASGTVRVTALDGVGDWARRPQRIRTSRVYWPECCDPSVSAIDGLRSLLYPDQSGDPPCAEEVLSALVTVMVSEEGESEMVRELKMPLISRRSSDTWSLGAVVLSFIKSLMERMMGGQDSSLGSHQSDGPAPIDSSIRLRRTSEYMYLYTC
jgi:hypothetical protein